MIDEKAHVSMVRARNAMLFTQPFFGSLVMNLWLEENTSMPGFSTAATDGKKLFYNPDYINQLNKESPDNEYVKSLVAHEALHCVFEHVTRKGNRNHLIWNYACDYIVNDNLKEAGFKVHNTWLLNSKYSGWTADKVYDDLVKNLKFSEDGTPINLPGEGGGELADHHLGDDAFPDKESVAENSYSAEELEEKWKDALASAYEAGKEAGNIPGSIHKLMDSITKPKIKWHEVLRNRISEYMKSDFTWMRPNKRFFNSGIILPDMDKIQKISLAIAIDTSGSISTKDMAAFMGEINSIVNMYSDFEINVACFDTKVESIACLKSQDDFDQYLDQLKGGGGTDFMAWWDWALNEEWYDKTNAVLFFTDGYPGGKWLPDEAMYGKDIFWIVKGSNNKGPVGTTLFYDDE